MDIRKVESKRDLLRFINFPHQLYKGDENYVPALNLVTKRTLSKKNPFLKHSEIALFLAIKDGRIVGRIAAIYNKTHLDVYDDNTGFFGFFDSVDEVSVAKKLFETCEQWLADKGIEKVIGPTNLTTNDSSGFLVEGFHLPPMVLMPYNKAYYNHLCTESGYTKSIDLFSYDIDVNFSLSNLNHIYSKALEVMKSRQITIRNMSKKTFQKDSKQLRFVYNKVNENNWGFMPLNEEEFKEMANDLKMAAPLDLTFLVEKDDEIIGFLIAVPNLNQVQKFIKNGKLFPFGIFKFLFKKRTINSARYMIMGILDEYKGMGIDLVLYKCIQDALNKRNIFKAEGGYILENNQRMNSILKKLSKGIIKTYRIYEKSIRTVG